MKVFMMIAVVMVASRVEPARAETGLQQESPRFLCGRVLAEARMLYCFSANDGQKRSIVDSPLIGSLYPNKQQDLMWPWKGSRSKYQALAIARGKRDPGLVDECCLKACYLSELLNYC